MNPALLSQAKHLPFSASNFVPDIVALAVTDEQ
jgi:hypothetical protein